MDPSQPDTPSNTIHLRPAEQADDAAIHAMIRKERLNPLAITWSHFVLAVTQSGEIIGCCQVKTHRDGSRELASLVVCPEWRGRGVARLLIEYLLEHNPGTLYLTCMDRLEPLYQRFGFQTLHDPATFPSISAAPWAFSGYSTGWVWRPVSCWSCAAFPRRTGLRRHPAHGILRQGGDGQDGLTPGLAGMIEPSTTYKPGIVVHLAVQVDHPVLVAQAKRDAAQDMGGHGDIQ